jgi:hypothetical protein
VPGASFSDDVHRVQVHPRSRPASPVARTSPSNTTCGTRSAHAPSPRPTSCASRPGWGTPTPRPRCASSTTLRATVTPRWSMPASSSCRPTRSPACRGPQPRRSRRRTRRRRRLGSTRLGAHGRLRVRHAGRRASARRRCDETGHGGRFGLTGGARRDAARTRRRSNPSGAVRRLAVLVRRGRWSAVAVTGGRRRCCSAVTSRRCSGSGRAASFG